MTTTIRAHFDGKVLVPHGQVDLPIDKEVMLQVTRPPRRRAQTKEEFMAILEEMDKRAVKVDHYIDHSRESCYDDTIPEPDPHPTL